MGKNPAVRAVVQRVSRAAATVGGEVVGACGPGLLVLLGVAQGDTDDDATLWLRELERIAQQVRKHLKDPGRVEWHDR